MPLAWKLGLPFTASLVKRPLTERTNSLGQMLHFLPQLTSILNAKVEGSRAWVIKRFDTFFTRFFLSRRHCTQHHLLILWPEDSTSIRFFVLWKCVFWSGLNSNISFLFLSGSTYNLNLGIISFYLLSIHSSSHSLLPKLYQFLSFPSIPFSLSSFCSCEPGKYSRAKFDTNDHVEMLWRLTNISLWWLHQKYLPSRKDNLSAYLPKHCREISDILPSANRT